MTKQFFKTFFTLAILLQRNRDRREIFEKLNMSYESLVRMVEYSHKMVEKILKKVEDNFIARKELIQFSKFLVEVRKIEIDRIFHHL